MNWGNEKMLHSILEYLLNDRVRLCQGPSPTPSWLWHTVQRTIRTQNICGKTYMWNSHRQTAFELDDPQWAGNELRLTLDRGIFWTLETSRSESFYDHQWNFMLTHSSRSMTISETSCYVLRPESFHDTISETLFWTFKTSRSENFYQITISDTFCVNIYHPCSNKRG